MLSFEIQRVDKANFSRRDRLRSCPRKRDGIPTAVEGDPCVEDSLCLVCCAPFAQCQVARQEYDAATYAFVSMNGADAV
jgi:hypothetical protein